MRTIKKILKINEVKDFKVFCFFNTGEHRVIDFEKLFKKWKIKKGDYEYKLANDLEAFQQVEVADNTLVWKNISISFKDETGELIESYFDLDPIVLYENSELDESKTMIIGEIIKKARKEAGLTQQELAMKSGTSKHYISRIENNKSDIELMTLRKIVEGGLNRKLNINIQ